MLAIVRFDQKLTASIRAWGQPWYGFWKFIASQSIIGFGLLALCLALAGRLIFGHFAIVFVLAYVLASILQKFMHRQRPNFEKLTGYKMWIHTYSYPSGHATMSAAAATALSLMTNFQYLPWAWLIVGVSVSLALLIGVSRIMVGVHYVADVLFGWLCGFVVALGYVVLVLS